MTVVLCGVGADTTNVSFHDSRVPRIDAAGRFEYVPIPEKTRETTESKSYGDLRLRHTDGSMADAIASLTPDPDGDGGRMTDPDAIASYPPHHDPNFDAPTYGEHRPAYTARLAELTPGTDAVGFYTGLEDEDGRLHRYLIGWFRVATKTIIDPDDDSETKREKLARHPENAHAKRAVDGVPYRNGRRIVMVDGDDGALFDRAGPRLSVFSAFGGDRRGYYLDDEFARRFRVVRPAHDPDSGARADKAGLTRKPAVVCDLTADEFGELVED
ncbi:hypothetical protein [Haloarchaeobius sp. TZWWS8]|uniref:Nmad3 family putative nucleotide modification protein n=1 Tax=Haloarchaeobius sp. TZWWS8 TaxID=3446121 RepID=UPI003EBB3092